MIAYILSILIGPLFVYSLRVWRSSRTIAVSLSLAAGAALFFVWLPQAATALAQLVGVGRGADLILYMYSLSSFILILDMSLDLRRQNEIITRLAREIALITAGRGSTAAAPKGATEVDEVAHIATEP